MKHTITLEEMSFETKTRIAGSHSKKENKCLDLIVNPALNKTWYVVTNNKKIENIKVLCIKDAINLYNSL